ncbi:MAG: hypothetical protein QOJ81_460, partial [Chloroflexota bacterium]|nr:hypothetical protein [Chloroflexota bacterium]
MDGGRGKYRADWNTTASGQPAGSLSRIEIRLADAPDGPACNHGVSLGSGCVGYFDVGLFKRHHRVPLPDGVRPVALGRTLPIKFHIAQGALTPPDEGATQLAGDPGTSAADAVPNLDFQFSPDDYSPDPDLGGLTVSFDTLFLVFKLDTTVGQANDLLAQIGAHIIGGRTGKAGDLSGILYIRVSTTTAAEM